MFNEILYFLQLYWLNFLIGILGIITGVIFILSIIKTDSKAIKMDMKKERSTFSKIAISIIFFVMLLFSVTSFFASSSRLTISNGIIYILGLMIFLIISDSIETFSIGNLITLKKEVENKKEEVKKLTSENSELRTQIVSIMSASITNQNRNQVFLGIGETWLKNARVEQTTSDDTTDEEQVAIENAESDNTNSNQSSTHMSPYNKSMFFRMSEEMLINKFTAKNEIDPKTVQQRVRISEHFTYSDPIMESKLVFDAYIKRPLDELFIETTQGTPHVHLIYRIYYMISAIIQYAQINNKAARLVILVPVFPDEWMSKITPHRNQIRDIERLENTFQPAIKNGFLEIKRIEFNEKDCNEIEQSIQQK